MSSTEPPAKLKQAAFLQLLSGLINVFVMAALVTVLLGTVGGGVGSVCGTVIAAVGCPLGCLGFFGWVCGLWGLVLLPIGMLEIAGGAMGLLMPESSGTVMRAAALAEMASFLFGGVVSGVVGVVTMGFLREPEVAGYLD